MYIVISEGWPTLGIYSFYWCGDFLSEGKVLGWFFNLFWIILKMSVDFVWNVGLKS